MNCLNFLALWRPFQLVQSQVTMLFVPITIEIRFLVSVHSLSHNLFYYPSSEVSIIRDRSGVHRMKGATFFLLHGLSLFYIETTV